MLEYQVDFPEKIKVAVLVGMVCKEMQDEVFRDTADLMKEGAYGKVQEIMKRIAGNRRWCLLQLRPRYVFVAELSPI